MNVRSQYGQERGLSTAQVASRAELQLDEPAKGSTPRSRGQYKRTEDPGAGPRASGQSLQSLQHTIANRIRQLAKNSRDDDALS